MITIMLNNGDEVQVMPATSDVTVRYDPMSMLLTATAAAEPEPEPEPPTDTSLELWISQSRLLALPTTGDGWNAVLAAAKGEWGRPEIGELDAMHDVYTLAGALVAIRLNDNDMRTNVIAALRDAQTDGGPYVETLRLARNITSYVIAAGIVGYREPAFVEWLRRLLTLPLKGHSGGDSLLLTAKYSTNNWGTHARAAVTALAIYLNDQDLLASTAKLFARWLGEVTDNSTLKWSSTTHHQSSPKRGINGPGTQDDGGLPEEMRRSGSSRMYGPEGLQGALVNAELLYNAGYTDVYEWGDQALLRAAKYVDTKLGGFTGDDAWQPYIYRARYGANAAKGGNPKSMGKSMAWTAWTHGSPSS